MVKTEFYRTREDGVNLYRTYSDEQYMIRKIGTDELYEEAVDVENAPYEYEETDIKIEIIEENVVSEEIEYIEKE